MKTTTLAKIKAFNPNNKSWEQLLSGLGKTAEDDEPLPYYKIVEICGFYDALCTTCTEDDFGWILELLIKYTRRASHLMLDTHPVATLDVARRFILREASLEEFVQACIAHDDATNNTQYSAIDIANNLVDIAISAALCIALDSASKYNIYSACATSAEDAFKIAYETEKEWQEQEFLRVVS